MKKRVIPKDCLVDWYVNKRMGITTIGKMIGTSYRQVARNLCEYGLKREGPGGFKNSVESCNRRSVSGRAGAMKRHGTDLSKNRMHSAGYVLVPNPDTQKGRKLWVFEQRLVAERALGRKLRDNNEVVHHINGKKTDNRNSNLLICTIQYHKWLHNRMSELYMKEHFA